jgi:hypothetical protein
MGGNDQHWKEPQPWHTPDRFRPTDYKNAAQVVINDVFSHIVRHEALASGVLSLTYQMDLLSPPEPGDVVYIDQEPDMGLVDYWLARLWRDQP